MNLKRKLAHSILVQRIIQPGDRILIGVSGGPDSMTLLHLLNALKYDLGLHLSVAHVNHGLRRGADKDQKLVERTCKRLGLECTVIRLSIKKTKASLEEIAREKRLAALSKLAKKKKIHVIALGHTKDDLAETVLMRILRGTGLMGLQGIWPRRIFKNICIIRPLLSISRKNIETFLKKEGIASCQDPTNRQTKFYRNKVRLQLLPLLEKHYNPNIKEVLARLADTCSVDYAFLENFARLRFVQMAGNSSPRKLRIPLKKLLAEPLAVQRLVLRMALGKVKGSTRQITLDHMLEIENLIQHRPVSSVVHLPKNLSVRKEKTHLILSQNSWPKQSPTKDLHSP